MKSTPAEVVVEGEAAPDGVRQQIVCAARACFVRLGAPKTSMADIAQEAKLSRGTVYRYFPARADLIEGVFAYESQLFLGGMGKQLARLTTIEDQIVECAGMLAAFEHGAGAAARGRIPVGRERLAALLTTHSEPLLRDTVHFLVPYVQRAMARGELRADLDVEHASEWIGRMLFTISSMPAVTFSTRDVDAWRQFFREHVVRPLASASCDGTNI